LFVSRRRKGSGYFRCRDRVFGSFALIRCPLLAQSRH
jgi:hypothetical protein